MRNKLDNLIGQERNLSPELNSVIKDLSFRREEMTEIAEMKRTSGWKIMDSKIRETLHQRITDLTKDDASIQSLLTLLVAGNTKSMSQQLESEIDKYLPE